MRTLAVAALTGFVALMVASTASAAPSFSVVFTGTTGSGTTGSSTLDAVAGDTVTLDVLLNIDAAGLTGFDFALIASNATAVSGAGCPVGSSSGSSNNLLGGTCFTATFQSIATSNPGGAVVLAGSEIQQYTAVTVSPIGGPQAQPMWVGRGVFTVGGAGSITVGFNPLGTINLSDGTFTGSSSNPVATIVPEPGTMGLMGLGMAALGLAGRRRK